MAGFIFTAGCHQQDPPGLFQYCPPNVLDYIDNLCGYRLREFVFVFPHKFKYMKNTEYYSIGYISSYSIYFLLIPQIKGTFDAVFPYEHDQKDCAANVLTGNDNIFHNLEIFNSLIKNYRFTPESEEIGNYFEDLMPFMTERGMPFREGRSIHFTKKQPQIVTRFHSKPYTVERVGDKYYASVITILSQGDAGVWDFVILPDGTIEDFKFTTYNEVFLN
jgi:hypothetical protein